MALKFMWGFEIGADVDYYANSGWGVAQEPATGSDYALYDTQYGEAHLPPTKVGAGYKCLKITSYNQWWMRATGDPMPLYPLMGTYAEVSTPVTGTVEDAYHWNDGLVHFSFKHDFDFGYDISGLPNAREGKWIHLCTISSASSPGHTAFKDGGLIRATAGADMWMPLPNTAPAEVAWLRQGWRAENSHIQMYLVRQERLRDPLLLTGGGPCGNIGDYLVCVLWRNNTATGAGASAVSLVSGAVDLTPNQWSKFAIQYKASPNVLGRLAVYQNGASVINLPQGFRTVEDKWNCLTFSSHGRYVTTDTQFPTEDAFPGGVWPEYASLIDYLFMWDVVTQPDLAAATSSLFIQGLEPDGDHKKGDFINDTGFQTPNLYDWVNDPGDPSQLEVSYISAGTAIADSCSFFFFFPESVKNGALSWGDYIPQIKEVVGLNAIAACAKSGSGGSTNYRGSAILGRAANFEMYGSASLITSNRMLWAVNEDAIGTAAAWSYSNIQAAKAGFKVEPE